MALFLSETNSGTSFDVVSWGRKRECKMSMLALGVVLSSQAYIYVCPKVEGKRETPKNSNFDCRLEFGGSYYRDIRGVRIEFEKGNWTKERERVCVVGSYLGGH